MLSIMSYDLFMKSRVRQSAMQAVGRYREKMRKAGLRPIQIWVPDTRSPVFAKECRRQSALLKNDPAERAALEFIEAVSDRGTS